MIPTAQQPDPIFPRNLKILQILGVIIIPAVVVAIALKAISGEIDAGTPPGGFEVAGLIAGSVVPAVVLVVFSSFLKLQKHDDVQLRLALSIVLIGGSAVGIAASAFLATTSLFRFESLLVLLGLVPPGAVSFSMAFSITSSVIHYGAVVLYVLSLPASIKDATIAVAQYKAIHPDRYWNGPNAPPAAQVIPSRHPGVTSNFCRRCGALNDPRSRFCYSCGGPLY